MKVQVLSTASASASPGRCNLKSLQCMSSQKCSAPPPRLFQPSSSRSMRSQQPIALRCAARSGDGDDIEGFYEEDDEVDEDTDHEPEGETFDDVAVTLGSGETAEDEEERTTIVWADYLASNVEGVTEEVDPDAPEADMEGAAHSMAGISPKEADAAETAAAAAAIAPVVSNPAHEMSLLNRLYGGETLSLKPDAGPQSEWDLRAAMEKRRRMEKEKEEWLQEKERTQGQYPSRAADWRNDVRIKDTGDPSQPTYREWTMREIWDLITLGGVSVDPREVIYSVRKPNGYVDFVAEGFCQQPDIPEWLEMQGKLISEGDTEVADRDAEVALLASEFTDFEDFGGTAESTEAADDSYSGVFK